MSIIIPAHDEAALIGRCLDAILASDPRPGAGSGSLPLPMPVEVIVVANGCADDTAAQARALAPRFRAAGWDLHVLELAEAGKMAALDAGDARARFGARVYLDADVAVSPPLLDQIGRALQVKRPAYASGRVRIVPPKSIASRLYASFYRQVPFMKDDVPGCGLFAVNRAGRRRWGRWPDIISDDTFARLHFTPRERVGVGATYDWPVVEGFGNLVRVRARQNAGVREVARLFPELVRPGERTRPGMARLFGLMLRNPPGFAVYAAVALATKLRRGADGWSRGR